MVDTASCNRKTFPKMKCPTLNKELLEVILDRDRIESSGARYSEKSAKTLIGCN